MTVSSNPPAGEPSIQLKKIMRDLHLDAGLPSTRDIAKGVMAPARAGTKAKSISHTTVAKILNSPHMASWYHLEAVAGYLQGDVSAIRQLWKESTKRGGHSGQEIGEHASQPRFEIPATLPGINARQEELSEEQIQTRREYSEVELGLFAAYEERASIDDRIAELRSEVRQRDRQLLENDIARLRQRRDELTEQVARKEEELNALREDIAEQNEELKALNGVRADLFWSWARDLEEKLTAMKSEEG
ncbi:hypothetical protein [Actinoplanes sp. NPDC049265]|uniref:hypothetical protein n=1 Tax=Actinoplanes sp. NPDC049265 TaxID=3363902 RepID=UPI0037209EED